MAKIIAVVVTYKPDQILLSRLLQTLSPQVTGGIIVNNGKGLPLTQAFVDQTGFSVRHMNANVGVATALNVGFRWAQTQAAEFVITFDQDSEPAPNMVSCLIDAYQSLVAAGHKVGAVGPQRVDSRTGRLSPFIAPMSLLRHRVIPAKGECLAVQHLITSGCLVPLQVWVKAGRFLDELFIDYVDIEWSLRLRHYGWHLYGVRNASMQHSIGDKVRRLVFQDILSHNPHRHYYMFRNAVFLQKLPTVPSAWKFAELVMLLRRFIFYAAFVSPRRDYLRFMRCGLRDGFLNRLGRLPDHE